MDVYSDKYCNWTAPGQQRVDAVAAIANFFISSLSAMKKNESSV